MDKRKYRGGKGVLATLIPLLLTTGVAMAMPPSGPLSFDDFDLNGDGVITRQEMDQVRSHQMGAAKAPAVTSGPAQPAAGRGMGRGERQGQMPGFQDFDLNGDGVLSEDEFIEARGQRVAQRAKEGRQMRGLSQMMQFSDLDQNQDGKVDEKEFQAAMLSHQQTHMQSRGPGRGGMGRPGMNRLDQNGDGYVSQEEFEVARARHMAMRNQYGMTRPDRPAPPAFPDIDSNGDGRISPEEVNAFRAERMRNWGPYPR